MDEIWLLVVPEDCSKNTVTVLETRCVICGESTRSMLKEWRRVSAVFILMAVLLT